jgi:hypothetical protein
MEAVEGIVTDPAAGSAGGRPSIDPLWDIVAAAIPMGARLVRLVADERRAGAGAGSRWRDLSTALSRGSDVDSLPPADGVVLEDVLPALLAVAPDHAANALAALLRRYRFVIVDCCSWTETTDDHDWKAACAGLPRTDLALKRALTASAASCFKLGRIPANGGTRTVFKIQGDVPATSGIVPLQNFERNHASWPLDKQLLEDGALPRSEVADHVRFTRAMNADGDQFWIKTYLRPDGDRIAALEQEIGLAAVEALETLRRLQEKRAAMIELMLPLRVDGASLIFPFDPDAVSAGPCHLQDWSHFLAPDLLRSVSILAAMNVRFRRLPSISLHNLCDFQIISAGGEATVLDFEPNPWVLRLSP